MISHPSVPSLFGSNRLFQMTSSIGLVGYGGKEFTELLKGENTSDLCHGILESFGIHEYYELKQVHGNRIIEPSELTDNTSPVEGDGWMLPIEALKGSGKAFLIRTADCLPIILLSDSHIALLHAGWRGLQAEIIERALDSFRAQGGSIANAFLGPAADPKQYEVGPEFQAYFHERGSCFQEQGKMCFDIFREASERLKEGHPDCEIEVADEFTITSGRFFSHRKTPASSHRNFTVIAFTSF